MTTKTSKVPAATILQYIADNLRYDPDTGIVSKYGKPIGSKRRKDNRIVVKLVVGKTSDDLRLHYTTYAHQVAWYLTHGEWATTYIDHINGEPADNRLSNLRLATPTQNAYNMKKGKKLTSSRFKGVSFNQGRWKAYLTVQGKCITVGRYPTEEEAALAYDTKATEVYGVFAKLNFGDNSAVSGEMVQLLLPWG